MKGSALLLACANMLASCFLLNPTDGSDYTGIDTSIILPLGSTNGNQSCVNIMIVNDDVVEDSEIFTVEASLGEGLSPASLLAVVEIDGQGIVILTL